MEPPFEVFWRRPGQNEAGASGSRFTPCRATALGWWVSAVFISFGALACPSPVSAQDPSFLVRGQVVEQGSGLAIPGASVRLEGRPTFISDSRGGFRFAGVSPGRHTLQVEGIGYRRQELGLLVTSDTSLVVALEVDPVALDSLIVEVGSFTLRGRVTDAGTGQRIPEARVRAGRGGEAYARFDGSFRLKGLPTGVPLAVLVDAYRYLPAQIEVVADQDTTVAIELAPDPLGIRLFEQATEQLDVRSRGVELTQTLVTREFIEFRAQSTLRDLINTKTRGHLNPECLFINEQKQPFLGILDTYQAGEVERIEVYGRGAMVRIYTQDFVARNLTRIQSLPPIVYINGICY